jgi:hypothetical protein
VLRRCCVLLLIPSLLANLAGAWAHSHVGTDIHEPAAHTLRPHIHTHGESHRHQGAGRCRHVQPEEREPLPSVSAQPPHHDDDAVYLSGAADVTLGRMAAASVASGELSTVDVPVNQADVAFTSRDARERHSALPVCVASTPLYLLTLAIRC